jgi:hypothetical protein
MDRIWKSPRSVSVDSLGDGGSKHLQNVGQLATDHPGAASRTTVILKIKHGVRFPALDTECSKRENFMF